ncbi:MAG: hypothetical protein AAF624_10360 [Bacteroidota bacterium]
MPSRHPSPVLYLFLALFASVFFGCTNAEDGDESSETPSETPSESSQAEATKQASSWNVSWHHFGDLLALRDSEPCLDDFGRNRSQVDSPDKALRSIFTFAGRDPAKLAQRVGTYRQGSESLLLGASRKVIAEWPYGRIRTEYRTWDASWRPEIAFYRSSSNWTGIDALFTDGASIYLPARSSFGLPRIQRVLQALSIPQEVDVPEQAVPISVALIAFDELYVIGEDGGFPRFSADTFRTSLTDIERRDRLADYARTILGASTDTTLENLTLTSDPTKGTHETAVGYDPTHGVTMGLGLEIDQTTEFRARRVRAARRKQSDPSFAPEVPLDKFTCGGFDI